MRGEPQPRRQGGWFRTRGRAEPVPEIQVDIQRELRKHERELGISLQLAYDGKTPLFVKADDFENSRCRFIKPFGLRSTWLQTLDAIHEEVYHARGRRLMVLQNGQCANCSRPLNNRAECDHIETRAKGRNDRMENLQLVCARMGGGCDFHARKHGQA